MWAALSAVALCGVFGTVLGLGQAVAIRHRAGGAADLAALTAADHALEGERSACARARRVAVAQGARVVRCAVRGEIADLDAAVRWGPYEPRVRSRAGPLGTDVDADADVDADMDGSVNTATATATVTGSVTSPSPSPSTTAAGTRTGTGTGTVTARRRGVG